MLYFLNLKDQVTNDALDHYSKLKNQEGDNYQNQPQFPALLSEEEIKSLLFDQEYINYIQMKSKFETSQISGKQKSGIAGP
jgi:hypothetical protein